NLRGAMSLQTSPAYARRDASALTGKVMSITRRQAVFRSSLAVRRQPFLYLAAALITGILLDRWLAAPRWLVVSVAAMAVAFAVRFIVAKKAKLATLALLVSVMLMGVWLSF